jgi:hypothetical protein
MDRDAELRDVFLRLFAGKAPAIMPGKVVEVDTATATCSVEALFTGNVYHGVRCKSTADGVGGVVIIPKVGSNVIIALMGGAQACVVAWGEVDSVLLNNGQVKLQLIGNKTIIKNSETSLIGAIERLVDALKNAIIQTPSGPGNFNAATVQALTGSLTDFKKILSDGTE